MTNKERLEAYESFFHSISIFCICMNNEKIKDAVSLINNWSYAHRAGNGELSEKEQQKMIDIQTLKMREF